MAGKPNIGEGLTADLAGMTKNQLYDIMSQMKALIEQNEQQARDILIQNPLLTKALFQAQIMLGMVQPPQVIPNIQAASSQQSQQSVQPSQQSHMPAAPSLTGGQVGLPDQTVASQAQASMRKHQGQTVMATSPASVPPVNLQSQPIPLHIPQQPKAHMNPQVNPMSVPQSSQLPNLTPPPLHSSSQPISLHQPQMPPVSNQLQPPLQTTGVSHMPLQPPMPLQPRPANMPSFHHQYATQIGPNVGFQHTGAPQHPSQSIYHSANKSQPGLGPSFPQGQPPLPSQLPPQSLYQVGGGQEFNNQAMQVDRGSWMSGPPDSSAMTQLPGPPPLAPGPMGPGNQPARPAGPPLTPEMEKALLQQVMSLTPEQINLLPPEQRNQVLQLQQMLRQ